MDNLIISEIQIIPVKPRDGLIAFASCVVNASLYIGNIAIYTCPSIPDEFRLTYPIKTLPNGKEISCVHPINKKTGEAIRKAIVEKYKKLTQEVYVENSKANNVKANKTKMP